MEALRSFLGTGWGFPPEFNKGSGQVKMISDQEDIQSSLEILMSTRKRERVMRDYGCNLDELVFEQLSTTFKTYIKDLILTAILYDEPRIEVNSITIDDENELEGRLLIVIDYTVRATNSRYNFVYPFYKTEASELK